jgi:hypothetical protein
MPSNNQRNNELEFTPTFGTLHVRAFSTSNLLMTSTMNSTGTLVYSRSQDLAIARSADLRHLLDNSMLEELSNGKVKHWLNGAITERTKPSFYKYIRERLNIREWRVEELVQAVTKDFLPRRDDEWLISFYRVLYTQKQWFSNLSLIKSNRKGTSSYGVPFLQKEIIRLQTGEHVKPFRDNSCLQPSAYVSEEDIPGFHLVKRSLLSDSEVRAFLSELGYSKPDETEYTIEYILPTLSSKDSDLMEDFDSAVKTAKKIILAWENGNKEQKILIEKGIKGKKWLSSHSFEDHFRYALQDHESCYIINDDLSLYFEGSSEHFYVSDELKDEYSTLRELGVSDTVRVTFRKPNSLGHVTLYNDWGNHVRGLNRFDPEAKIDGLMASMCKTIEDKNVDRGRFIWNNLLVPHKHLIKGKVEESSRKDYTDSQIYDRESRFCWITLDVILSIVNDSRGKEGKGQLTIDDLPDGFIRDLELAEMLGLEVPVSDPITDLAREIGLPKELLLEFKDYPERISEFIKLWNKSKSKMSKNNSEDDTSPEFPKTDLYNPERRVENVSNCIHEEPDKRFEKKTRSVRTSGRSVDKEAYLKNFYTNSNEEMVCQLCKKIMPFKKRNGEYYFEAVELLSKELISKESESMYLALCPICAAKYKEYIKLDSNKIQNMIKQIRSSEIEEIAIETDHPEILKFNPPHYLDVRTILTELIDPED